MKISSITHNVGREARWMFPFILQAFDIYHYTYFDYEVFCYRTFFEVLRYSTSAGS